MKLKSLFIILVLFAALFAAAPAHAEGPATPEATPVIVSPTGQPVAVQIVSEVSVIVYLALGALIGGSGVLAATLIVVRSVLNSPVLISTLENLAKSWPAPVRELAHDVGQLAAEIADDVPYTTKLSGAVSTAGTTLDTRAIYNAVAAEAARRNESLSGAISHVKTYATPEQVAGLPEAKG